MLISPAPKQAVKPSGEIRYSRRTPKCERCPISGLPILVRAMGMSAVPSTMAVSVNSIRPSGSGMLRPSGPTPLAAQDAAM